MAIGVSFLDDQAGGNGQSDEDRYQEAVQILSMRVPRILGGGAMAPAPLLQGTGMAGSPFSNDTAMAQAFARMAGIAPMGGGMPPMSGGGAPASPMGSPQGRMPPQGRIQTPRPRVVPGIDPTGAPPPQGPATREWTPPEQGTIVRNANPMELETAAQRSARGYNPPMWNPNGMRGLF